MFNSDALAKQWWDGIAAEWKAKYPNVKLNLVGVGGTDVDEMNKAALLFRSTSRRRPTSCSCRRRYVSQFGGSGYLADLSKYVGVRESTAPFWSKFPKNVQDMGRFNGTLYAINCGNNDSAVVYNKTMLAKAGVQDAAGSRRRGTTSSRPRDSSRSTTRASIRCGSPRVSPPARRTSSRAAAT